jgi:predicted branched-subunit amino acid permease
MTDKALRDGVLLALTTLPLSFSVTRVGVESGVPTWMLIASSTLMFSAAAQLLLYKAFSAEVASFLALASIAGIGLRLAFYARHLHGMMSGLGVCRRVLYLVPLTDISYVEFLRSAKDLRRYIVVSRCLWVSWIFGTVAAIATGYQVESFPKEAVGLLIFSCLMVAALRRPT